MVNIFRGVPIHHDLAYVIRFAIILAGIMCYQFMFLSYMAFSGRREQSATQLANILSSQFFTM